MDDQVVFEGDQAIPMGTAIRFTIAESKMEAWLMRCGVARSGTQAKYVLLGIVGLAIAISISSWVWLTPKPPPHVIEVNTPESPPQQQPLPPERF